MREWITAYRCGFCKHIYYNKEFRFDKICPKCGHKNYFDNPWPGDHLEYVLIRKRLFHGWEVKEVEPNMQRKCRIKYTAPKFESDLLKLTSMDEPKILELCKDYLAGTWIIVETSKKHQTKYRQLKIIQNKKIGDFYVTTYLTDKIVNNSDEKNTNLSYALSKAKRYLDLDSLDEYYDQLSKVTAKYPDSSHTIVTAYSSTEPIYSFSNISDANIYKVIAEQHISDDGMVITTYRHVLPNGTIAIQS